jgi:pentatricopeptide repeat protein
MYNSVIAACGIRWKPALEAFLGMQCAGVDVTAQTATLLMASLCAAKQRDHALALLGQVRQARWVLSLTAYTSLLKLLASLGDWRAADMCHSHMMYSGIRPDAAAAAAIVNAHAIGGDNVGAEQFTHHFISLGILPHAASLAVQKSSRNHSSQGGSSKASPRPSIDVATTATTTAATGTDAATASVPVGAVVGSDGSQSLPISEPPESLESEPLF